MLTTAEVSQFLVTFSSVVSQNDFKVQELPLARIKKIMKQDEEVKVNVFASTVGSFAAHFHVDIGLVIIHRGYYIVEHVFRCHPQAEILLVHICYKQVL